jgi:tRNA/rRNA methyltransferase
MLKAVRIVLVRPIYSGNIGAVCRVMANMGLSELVLAGAGIGDLEQARQMACGAQDILAACRQAPDLSAAVADCTVVVGATARQGLYRGHSRTPRDWAPEILAASRAGKVALVFGPEDNGLSNEEIAICTRLMRIPSSSVYPSLNLSHAVMVCAYELFMAAGEFELPPEKSPEAVTAKKERMFAMWERMLLQIGFMEPDKAAHMMQGVRRILTRGRLSDDDVRILMGIARQMEWYVGTKKRSGAAGDSAVAD